jgi:broad specificity phosphatase PhoE
LRARAARWTRAILAKHPNWDNSNDSNAASALGGSAVPIPRRTFYFLRNGETDWNVEGRFQGHSDIPLNAQGLAQARAAAQIMADRSVDLIVASPLIRALKTAAIVAEAIGKPLRIDSELKERPFGDYEGQAVNEVKRKLGVPLDQRLVRLPDNAEQWPETGVRTIRVLSRWLDAHPDETILFVSHSGLIDSLHERIFGVRVQPKHAPYRWHPGPDGWSCEALG